MNDPQAISKLQLFIYQCNWKEKVFPWYEKTLKKCESNNKSIAHNVLFSPHIGKKVRQAYISKYNAWKLSSSFDDYRLWKWHDIAIRSWSTVLRRVTSKNNCINCLHSVRVIVIYGYLKKIILKYKKKIKTFICYLCWHGVLTWKADTCHSNPKMLTAKINKHTVCGLFIIYKLFIW